MDTYKILIDLEVLTPDTADRLHRKVGLITTINDGNVSGTYIPPFPEMEIADD